VIDRREYRWHKQEEAFRAVWGGFGGRELTILANGCRIVIKIRQMQISE
jgi:hypothetical protein